MKKGVIHTFLRAFFLLALVAFIGGGSSAYNKLNKLVSDNEKSEKVIESENESKFSDEKLRYDDDHGSALFLHSSSFSKNLFVHQITFKLYHYVEVTSRLYLFYLSLKLDC